MPCHMETGDGVQKLVPAFSENTFSKNRNKAICTVIHGATDSTNDRVMPAFPKLTNTQIANVLNFITKMKEFSTDFYNDQEVALARNAGN